MTEKSEHSRGPGIRGAAWNAAKSASKGLSRAGEVLGWNWLIYHHGIFLRFRKYARVNAPKFADAVQAIYPAARSISDVGCGSGEYAAEFQRRGMRVRACEYAERGRRWTRRLGVEVLGWDLSKPDRLPVLGPCDVAYSIEVAEHVPESLAEAFVAFVTSVSGCVVFTAAPPGQGGEGHINEQPKEYWIEKFERRGFQLRPDAVDRMVAVLMNADAASYLWRNCMVFERRVPAPDRS